MWTTKKPEIYGRKYWAGCRHCGFKVPIERERYIRDFNSGFAMELNKNIRCCNKPDYYY